MWLVCAFLTWVNILVFVLLVSAHGHGLLGVTDDLKAVDVASIALLAATLTVIVVGLGIAILTLIGYREIKIGAIAAATEAATLKAADVARSVATRTALDTPRPETTAEDAEDIARAEND